MTRIECAVATHGNLSMKLLTEQDGRALPVGEVLLSRPPRIALLDPDRIFWSSLMMFGPRLDSPVSTNLVISEDTRSVAEQIWGQPFTVAENEESAVFSPTQELLPETARVLEVTTRSLSMERRETNDSVLQVLPLDQFNGTLATLFDIAVTTNAVMEARRLHGEGSEALGSIAIASCFAPALQATHLNLRDDVPVIDFDDRIESTLKQLNLTAGFGQ